jgi:predicted ATP-dependent serine protease
MGKTMIEIDSCARCGAPRPRWLGTPHRCHPDGTVIATEKAWLSYGYQLPRDPARHGWPVS